MPKLTVNSAVPVPDDQKGRKKPVEFEPRCRPCPRCYVPLVLERQHRIGARDLRLPGVRRAVPAQSRGRPVAGDRVT